MDVETIDLGGVCRVGTTCPERLEIQNDEVEDDETSEGYESLTAKEFYERYSSEQESSSTGDPSDGDDWCICEECEGDIGLMCSANQSLKDSEQKSVTRPRGECARIDVCSRSCKRNCAVTAKTVHAQDELVQGEEYDKESTVCQPCKPQAIEWFLYVNEFMQSEELLMGEIPVVPTVEDESVVLVAIGSYSPIRRCHMEMMHKAREHYAWQGRRVAKARFVPNDEEKSLTVSDKRRPITAAISEENWELDWLECYEGEGVNRSSLEVDDEVLKYTKDRYTWAQLVKVVGPVGLDRQAPVYDRILIHGTSKLLGLLECGLGPALSETVRSAISEIAKLPDHELIQWWQTGGRRASATGFDSDEYRVLTQHCHQSVIAELFQIRRGVRLEPLRPLTANTNSSQNLTRRICAAVSQGFGSSIRSFCTGEDLSVD